MAIPSLTLRDVKGSALTFAEMDTNLQNLANAKVAITAGGTTSNIALNGTTGAPTAITFANSATVQATQSGGTVTFVSNITATGMSSLSITAGGTTSANTAFTIANSSVGASMTGNTITLNMASLGAPATYTGHFSTDAYGRVSTAGNVFLGNVNANQNWIGNVRLNNATFGTYSETTANIGAITGNVAIDANLAPIQLAGTSGNIQLWANAMSNFSAGESVTLLLRHNGNNRIISSDLLWVNQSKTIGGSNVCVDGVTIFYDGQNYLASTVKYQA